MRFCRQRVGPANITRRRRPHDAALCRISLSPAAAGTFILGAVPPRTRRYYRELAAHATVGLAGLAIFIGGLWAARQSWDDGKITLPSAVAAGLLLLVGGIVLRSNHGAWRETIARHRALPPLRRLPTTAEVAAYRATIDQALAAIAAARCHPTRDYDLTALEDSLRLEHTNAVEALRESVTTGYRRWLGGELDLASWGPPYAAVYEAAAAVSAHHARLCQTPAP
jgi:hypothetical protein